VEAAVAVAKVGKYASSESGDTLEMIERPGGGISFVLSDGQQSGKSAKAISNVVARKAISLLAEGVRDGAAARAASDYLYTYRSGKVQATLNILSIDLQSQTLVLTRNNPAPVLVIHGETIRSLDAPSSSIGSRRGIRPDISEIGLEPDLTVVVFTDGLLQAGERSGAGFDVAGCVAEMLRLARPEPARWAEDLLGRAVELDEGRPADDITVLVAAFLDGRGDDVRRLSLRMAL
jgi:serine phosphatase RsbU (regulator of sigma subunit)